MTFYLPFIIANILIGYLFGSISWSIIIGKKIYNKDLREYGSKNAGATNSLRVYGKLAALVILVLDILKTIIPVIIIWSVTKYVFYDSYSMYITNHFHPLSLIYLCAFFVVIGHCYPIFFKFKGGKGATSYGAFLLIISPFIALFALLIFILIIKKWKMVSLSTLIVSLFIPLTIFIPGVNYFFIVNNNFNDLIFINYSPYFSLILLFFILYFSTGIVFLKHSNNIKRILLYQENKIKW